MNMYWEKTLKTNCNNHLENKCVTNLWTTNALISSRNSFIRWKIKSKKEIQNSTKTSWKLPPKNASALMTLTHWVPMKRFGLGLNFWRLVTIVTFSFFAYHISSSAFLIEIIYCHKYVHICKHEVFLLAKDCNIGKK